MDSSCDPESWHEDWLTEERIDAICDRFERHWQEGQRPSVEELLEQVAARDRRAALRELLHLELDYLAASGETAERAEYRRRFPKDHDLIDAVWSDRQSTRFRIEATRLDDDRSAADQGSRQLDLAELPAEFGEYELLEEAGRGGMGVVYRARQVRAQRIVALKLIRPDRWEKLPAGKRQRVLRRFSTEAKAAAAVDHEHIVRVFEVGECQGHPFYSMSYIEGSSIAERVADGPLDGPSAARYLEPVARALHAAHQRRVLHRDLKPHNLLIDRSTDRAIVTDFGLAKLLESPDPGTHTGEVFGSPGYISPEQASDASQVTLAADIYGLGATLYHCLTGRPPFQAASVAQTLQQVLSREPLEPRRLNPNIDADLETICLKCLQKEPSRRYRSAGGLADDLASYLRGDPIEARPLSRAGRFARWCRRNRAVSGLLGLAALLLAALLVGSLVATAITGSALGRAQASLETERLAKEELVDSVIGYVEMVNRDPVLAQPQLQALREELLGEATARLSHYVSAVSSTDEERLRAARVFALLADVHDRSGRLEEAIENLRQSQMVAESLDRPDSEVFELRAQNHLHLAELSLEQSDSDVARRHADQAIDLSRRAPEPPAIELMGLATLMRIEIREGRYRQAEAVGAKGLAAIGQLDEPTRQRLAGPVAAIHESRASLSALQGDWTSALEQIDQALAIQDANGNVRSDPAALSTPPATYFHQRLMRAEFLRALGHVVEASQEALGLVREIELLSQSQRSQHDFAVVLSSAYMFCAIAMTRSSGERSADDWTARAVESVANLCSRDAIRRSSVISEARLVSKLINLAHVLGDHHAAIRVADEFLGQDDSIFRSSANNPELNLLVAEILASKSLAQRASGELEEARETIELANETLKDRDNSKDYPSHVRELVLQLEYDAVNLRILMNPAETHDAIIQGFRAKIDNAVTELGLTPEIHILRSMVEIDQAVLELLQDTGFAVEGMLNDLMQLEALLRYQEMPNQLVIVAGRSYSVAERLREANRLNDALGFYELSLRLYREITEFYSAHGTRWKRRATSALAVANINLMAGQTAYAFSRYDESRTSFEHCAISLGGPAFCDTEVLGAWTVSVYFADKFAPDDVSASERLGWLSQAISNCEQVLDQREDGRSLLPAYASVLDAHARLSEQAGDLAAAIASLDKLTRIGNPRGVADLTRRLGLACLRQARQLQDQRTKDMASAEERIQVSVTRGSRQLLDQLDTMEIDPATWNELSVWAGDADYQSNAAFQALCRRIGLTSVR